MESVLGVGELGLQLNALLEIALRVPAHDDQPEGQPDVVEVLDVPNGFEPIETIPQRFIGMQRTAGAGRPPGARSLRASEG